MHTYSAYRFEDKDDKGLELNDSFLIVNSAGYFEFHENWSSRHRKGGRADYMLIYVHSGKMQLHANASEDIIICEGTCFLYRPGQDQLYRSKDESPVMCYWIHFTGYGIPELLQSLNINDISLFSGKVSNEIPSLIKMIIDETQYKKYGYETIVAGMLMQCITVISRNISTYNAASAMINTNGDIDLTLNYIYSHYTNDIKVSELANMSGLCVNRYINVFKGFTGFTPKEYIIHFRLQKASELFNSTKFSVKQVALMVGFQNQLYFSRIYKKYIGVTPSASRNG
jgi:AraC-like DNA-binding protein